MSQHATAAKIYFWIVWVVNNSLLSATLIHIFMGLTPHCSPLSCPSPSGGGWIQGLWEFSIHAAVDVVLLHLWLLWAVSHFGLFYGTPCGAKQAHINLHFVWIFRYSCLWHGDSSWCAWAPQISQCHAWTEAVASGPRQAQPALAGPSRPRISPKSHQWHPLHKGGQRLNKHL